MNDFSCVSSIFFLDIDGVLKPFSSDNAKGLSKDCVKNLCDVLKVTGAHIVISSDWRFGGIGIGSDLHQKLLQSGGDLIFDRIIGHTDKNDESRKNQILDFIILHSDWISNSIRLFVIDDDPDAIILSNGILTNSSLGFDDDCKTKLIDQWRTK